MPPSDATARENAEQPALENSREAFAQHHDYLCRALRRFGARREDVEDLAQDVFLVMCRRWPEYQPGRPLRSWLAGIAFNVAQKHGARRWREAPAGEVEIVDDSPQPDERLHAARASRMVLGALASMPPRDRAVLVLHQIDELSMQEVAALLQVPLFTAYTRLRRARRRFAQVVADLQAREPHPTDGPPPLSAAALLDLESGRLPAAAPARRRVVLMGATGALVAGLAALVVLGIGGRGRQPTPVAPAPALPGRALAGYWAFEDGAGSAVARDRSPAGRHCVLRDLRGERPWMDGALGGAIQLWGGWLECPQPPAAIRAGTELSVSAWVKVSPRKPVTALVTRQLDRDERDLFFFGVRDGYLMVRSSLWPHSLSSERRLPADRFAAVAFTHSADGTTRLFQDGELVAEATGNGWTDDATPTGPLTIGAGMNGPDGDNLRQHLHGSLDEVAVWDRALHPAEIAAIARLTDTP